MAKKRSRRTRRASQLWDVLGPLALIALLWRRRRRSQPPEQPPEPPVEPGRNDERPGAHLVPNQISLVIRHGSTLDRKTIDALIKTTPALEELRKRQPRVDYSQVATFGRDGGFSLVPVIVERQPNDRELLRVIRAVDEQLKAQGGSAPPDYAQQSPDATDAASRADSARTDAVVMRATPNWTAGAAIERNGSGSPGAKPIPYVGAKPPHERLGEWQERLLALLEKADVRVNRDTLGEGVDVYILDTAPDETDLARARERWGTTPLFDTLLAPDRLRVEYAGGTHLLQQVDLYHDNANYVMSDHGLFVASIIHALAPRARLHLVEVLNPYSVGSLLSIAHGFSVAADAVAANPNGKLLVNASLGFEVVPPVPDWLADVQRSDPFWAMLDADGIKDLMKPLEDICELFADAEPHPDGTAALRVVAAAGNDASQGRKQRPPARYPAAFDAVLGVGALDHNRAPTDYSNEPDNPPGVGVGMFGGERIHRPGAPGHGKTDPDHGMPGIYSGAFPDGEPNDTGWALWAGTSFATPIITGALAVVMSQNKSFGEALKILKDNGF